MSDDPQKAEVKEVNGTTAPTSENGTGPPTSGSLANGTGPQEPLTNGAVTRNKRVCRRKAAYKDDYTTKAANQVTVRWFTWTVTSTPVIELLYMSSFGRLLLSCRTSLE